MGTVSKALDLLNLFTRARPLLGLSDVARLGGLNKATCHRLLSELAEFGLVEQVGPAREYRLGPAVLRLSALREAQVPTREAAMPVLQALAQTTGETVHLSILVGGTLQSLAFAYSAQHATKVTMEDAETLPFHATSSGLVVLAFQSENWRAQVLGGSLPKLTPQTITDPATLALLLDQARKTGMAAGAGGYETEVHSLAVPLFDALGRCSGGLAVAAPGARMTPQAQALITPALIRAGATITTIWGGTLPPEIAEMWRDAA